jgi:hypothetical protein
VLYFRIEETTLSNYNQTKTDHLICLWYICRVPQNHLLAALAYDDGIIFSRSLLTYCMASWVFDTSSVMSLSSAGFWNQEHAHAQAHVLKNYLMRHYKI